MVASCQMKCVEPHHGQKCVDPGPLPNLTGKTHINQEEVCLNTRSTYISIIFFNPHLSNGRQKFISFIFGHSSLVLFLISSHLATGLLNGLNGSITAHFLFPSYFSRKLITNGDTGNVKNRAGNMIRNLCIDFVPPKLT